jgi:hypothetical protein
MISKLACVLLFCVGCTQTTNGTWSVDMQASTASLACGDPEPLAVTFMLQADTPDVSTSGLVASTQVAVECGGGPGVPTSTPSTPNDPYVPVTKVVVANDQELVFQVDTSTDPTDPMVTTYSLTLHGDQLVGNAAYHANVGCTDTWQLTATQN